LALGGVGLIVTGFMIPTRADAGNPRQIFVYEDDHIGGLQQVAEAIHKADNSCRLVAQIGHKGNIKTIEGEAYFFPGAKALEVKAPIILTGGNRSVDHLEQLLKTNEIDFIGMARPLIREPDLPNRWLRGIGDKKAACISCNGCFGVIMRGKTTYCIQKV